MSSGADSTFTRAADQALLGQATYQVYDWELGHRLSFPTVELTFGFDGFQQLADDAELGRRVRAWRERNVELAAQLDAEAALDALGAPPRPG
ncbi:MAG: hypothetical protein OEY23_05055 [Acidimicrobiia bacterium]|nr:hypothetical protein [Acidimicrobiia bacterium]